MSCGGLTDATFVISNCNGFHGYKVSISMVCMSTVSKPFGYEGKKGRKEFGIMV